MSSKHSTPVLASEHIDRARLRAQCLKIAMEMRTPASSPATLTKMADELFVWVMATGASQA